MSNSKNKDPRVMSAKIPGSFLDKMRGLLGDESLNFISSLNLPGISGLRVNTLKISPDRFVQLSPYQLSPIPWCDTGYVIDEKDPSSRDVPSGKHAYHAAGLYYFQEPSAMAPAVALAPLPGEKVLDLAAAPGGKTTHLACLMKNIGLLVANEIHPKRVWNLAENLERCGVRNTVITNESPEKLATHFTEYFDRVMLDAPCSCEGMFRKSEVARIEWKNELPYSCAIRQKSILEQSAWMVKPGGYLVYSTCTFSPEENEGVIDTFLRNHPEFDLAPLDHIHGLQSSKPEWIGLPEEDRLGRCKRIWPHRAHGEGHFIALMIKNGSVKGTRFRIHAGQGFSGGSYSHARITSAHEKILADFSNMGLLFSFDFDRLTQVGSYLYAVPEILPDLSGIRVIHPGWWLGSIQKSRFTPSHALAMGIHVDHAKGVIPLSLGDPLVTRYLHGETFPDRGEDAWVLITIDGFPLGWGKRIQNVVKNFYPHGLRKSY